MKKTFLIATCTVLGLMLVGASLLAGETEANGPSPGPPTALQRPDISPQGFQVEILVNGRPLEEYRARGKSYVEAVEGAEYEVKIHNPLPYRVAVALSVDGLNSIDARRTSAWNASKWVLGPYETIHLGGWQMSSTRARRFYFTTERESYASKLGQTSNLGVVSAVFFRELRPTPITIAPPPRPRYENDGPRDRKSPAPSAANGETQSAAGERREPMAQARDDEYAATGIGRSVQNDVRWVSLDLESRPAAEITIRYEYYQTLVRLGVLPRQYTRPDSLRKREGATGFEERGFSPEP